MRQVIAPVIVVIAGWLGMPTDARSQTPREVASLLEELTSKDPFSRLIAAKQLGLWKEKARDAIPILKQLASDDPDPHVRIVAANALSSIQQAIDAPAQPMEVGSRSPAEESKASDTRTMSPALKATTKKLHSARLADQVHALRKLYQMGTDARPAAADLIQYVMAQRPEEFRRAGMTVLEAIAPEIHPHVEALINEDDAVTQGAAMIKLANRGDDAKPTIPVIIEASRRHLNNTSAYPLVVIPSLYTLIEIGRDDRAVISYVVDVVCRPRTSVLYENMQQYATDLMNDSNIRFSPDHKRFYARWVRNAPQHHRSIIIDVLENLDQDEISLLDHLYECLISTLNNDALSGISLRASLSLLDKMVSLRVKGKEKANTLASILRQAPDAPAGLQVQVIGALAKLGADAKPALPLLKELKLSPVEAIQEAATAAVAEIEQAP